MHDLILFNANVITMDPALPKAELVAIRNGTIVEVSGNERLQALTGPYSHTIDCGGKTIVPGFIDAHCHVQAYAESFVSLDLSPRSGIDSIAAMQRRIRQRADKLSPGAWIRGRGYNEFYLAEGRHPNRFDLDAAAPENPVRLTHRSSHAHVLNSLALKQVGITSETGDPPEGLIDRDLETGEPTGLIFGIGSYLSGRIPSLSDEEIEDGLAQANERLLSYGITSLQDASSHNDLARWKRFERWKMRGLLKPRTTMMMGMKGFDASRDLMRSSVVDETHLRPGGVKIVIHEVTGSLSPSQEELNRRVLAIHEAGLQVVMHAVEVRTVEAACNAVESALKAHPRVDHRHRIEHCSLCPGPLLDRMHALRIVVVTQPPFIYHSGDRYLKDVPENEHRYLYPTGAMVRKDLIVGASSDFPIVDPDPLTGIYAAVTRMSENGRVVGSEEGVTVMEALRMYTVFAAAAGFEDDMKGSLTPGKLADLVVLSNDPLQVDPARLKDIRVEMTILGGEVVWSRASRGASRE